MLLRGIFVSRLPLNICDDPKFWFRYGNFCGKHHRIPVRGLIARYRRPTTPSSTSRVSSSLACRSLHARPSVWCKSSPPALLVALADPAGAPLELRLLLQPPLPPRPVALPLRTMPKLWCQRWLACPPPLTRSRHSTRPFLAPFACASGHSSVMPTSPLDGTTCPSAPTSPRVTPSLLTPLTCELTWPPPLASPLLGALIPRAPLAVLVVAAVRRMSLTLPPVVLLRPLPQPLLRPRPPALPQPLDPLLAVRPSVRLARSLPHHPLTTPLLLPGGS